MAMVIPSHNATTKDWLARGLMYMMGGFMKNDVPPTMPRAAFRYLRRVSIIELMAAVGIVAIVAILVGIVAGTMKL